MPLCPLPCALLHGALCLEVTWSGCKTDLSHARNVGFSAVLHKWNTDALTTWRLDTGVTYLIHPLHLVQHYTTATLHKTTLNKEWNIPQVPVLIPKQHCFPLQFSKLQQIMLFFLHQFLYFFSFFVFQLQQLKTQGNHSFLLDQGSSDLYFKTKGSHRNKQWKATTTNALFPNSSVLCNSVVHNKLP